MSRRRIKAPLVRPPSRPRHQVIDGVPIEIPANVTDRQAREYVARNRDRLLSDNAGPTVLDARGWRLGIAEWGRAMMSGGRTAIRAVAAAPAECLDCVDRESRAELCGRCNIAERLREEVKIDFCD